MKSSTAFMITDMLKDVISSSNGTGKRAAISGVYQAGKTGTTEYPSGTTSSSGVMDSWFTGYSKKYSISVWTGYDKQYETGHAITSTYEHTAAYVYSNEMSYLENESSSSDWTAPSTVTKVTKNGTTEYEVTGKSWSNTGVSDTYAENNGSSSSSSSSSAVTSSSTTSSSSAKQESESTSSSMNESTTGSNSGTGGNNNNSTTQSSSATSSSTVSSPTTTTTP